MKNLGFLIVIIVLGFVSCETEEAPKTLYEKIEREELKKGTRADSIFLGINFGMKKEDFFIHCADLNKDSIISEGVGINVLYDIPNDLKFPSRMLFYPDFREGEIFRMRTKWIYTNWSPWNKETHGQSLKKDIASLMKEWYGGNDFIRVPHPIDTAAIVKIDGNRRILIETNLTGTEVKATYTDLLVEKELIELAAKRKEEE